MENQKQIQKQLAELQRELANCQKALLKAQWVAASLVDRKKKGSSKDQVDEAEHYSVEKYPSGVEVIEGVFDGVQMVGPDSTMYPVPENYASKSKLVVGDRLKLTITPEGRFVYKQIGPVLRIVKRGVLLHDSEHDEYNALVDGREYKLLKASVTYYKGVAGDEVVVVLPEDQNSRFGAVDNIVKKIETYDTEIFEQPPDAQTSQPTDEKSSSEGKRALEEI